jgi:heme/copper-type cytochrome/quinol oxidase subunit 2
MEKVVKRIAGLFSFLAAVLVAVPSAMAQSCAMCYANASAAGAHERKSLSIGIVVLLLPTLFFFLGVFVLLIRRAHAATS